MFAVTRFGCLDTKISVSVAGWEHKCSNGHEWQTVSKQRCPNAECDYGEDE